MESSQESSTPIRQRTGGRRIVILIIGAIALYNSWLGWEIVLKGREMLNQAVTSTPLPEGQNIAPELAAKTINEGIMHIILTWVVFLLVYKFLPSTSD